MWVRISTWLQGKIDGEGGPPPIYRCCLKLIISELTRTILKPLDFLKRKKLVLVCKFFLRVFPLTISVVRLILWSAHGENQDLRTAVARCSWGWFRVRNSIPESSESSVSSSLVLWVQIHVDIRSGGWETTRSTIWSRQPRNILSDLINSIHFLSYWTLRATEATAYSATKY